MTVTEKLLFTSCPSCHHTHEVPAEMISHTITCTQCGLLFNAVKFDPSVMMRTFAKIAIQNQLIDEKQLEMARNDFEGEESLFAESLVKQGLISAQDKSRLFIAAVRKLNKKFTDIAVLHAHLSNEAAEKALLRQAEDFKAGRLTLIGDILIREDLLNYDQVDAIYQKFQKKKGPPVRVKGDEIYDKSGTLPLIGLIAVDKNIITRKQFEESLRAQKEAEQKGVFRYFEDVLLEMGAISEETLANLLILTIRKLSKKFAEIVLKKGFADKNAMEQALFRQSEEFKKKQIRPFCEILSEGNMISIEERDLVFEEFQGLKREKIEKLAQKAIALIRSLEKPVSEPAFKPEKSPPLPQEHSAPDTAPPKEAGAELSILPKQARNDERDKLIGELAVTYKLISAEQLKMVTDEQALRPRNGAFSLEAILLEKKLVSQSDINRLLSKQAFLETRDADLTFGKEAAKRGLATKDEVKSAFIRQSKIYGKDGRVVPIGDILVESKIISDKDRDDILRLHNREGLPSADTPPTLPGGEEEEVYLDEPEISISISEDALSAYVAIAKDLNRDIDASVDEWVQDIKCKVSEKGVCYGVISDSLIVGCLKSAVLKKKSFKIASGDPPHMGKAGRIIYHFETDYRKAGILNEGGFIDFRDRGDVPFVRTGELLAELSRTVQGKAGYDIFGNKILVPELPEFELKCGSGVDLSENGLKAFAAIDGMPKLSLKNEISVLPELVIKGDVDYEIGHIDFKGNVVVEGAVCQGFRVRAVNLTAKEVVGGEIDITGDLNVSAGIIDADIKAEGSVQAMYMYNSNVEAFGDLIIQKEILDSRAMISGRCKSEKCKIISSRISARKGFDVVQIGTSVSEPCRLRAGVNDHLDHVVGKVKSVLKEKTVILEAIHLDIEKNEKLDQENDSVIAEHISRKENLTQARQKAQKEIAALREKGDMEAAAILEANVGKVDLVVSSVSEKIRESMLKKDTLSQILTANRAKAEKIIEEIETLNEEIRVISSKVDQSESSPTVKVSGLITSTTIIMGLKSSIILPDDLKRVQITEIKISDPEAKGPTRWEMAIRKLR